jgi:exodeoxyribonuclease X
MRIVTLDTETTGIGETDEPVEIALVAVNGDAWHHGLVKPHVPCTVEARATHHITDAMLEEAPPLWFELQLGSKLCLWGSAIVVAAHNLAFDLRMLRQGGAAVPTGGICTWRCALHLFPDAPGHSNGVLRYHLGLEVPGLAECGLPPHRALPDALVTAALLRHMLETKTEQELLELTTTPVLLRTCRFGKHRGTAWAEIPRGYMEWILRQTGEAAFDADVRHTARHYLGT